MTVDIAQLLRDLLESDPDHYKVDWEEVCGPCGGDWPCTGERVRLAVVEISLLARDNRKKTNDE